MYTLPSKLKFFAIILMVIGALGIVTGFLSTPSNTDEVKEMLASSHDDGHQTDATHTESHSEQSHDENIHDDDGHYEHLFCTKSNVKVDSGTFALKYQKLIFLCILLLMSPYYILYLCKYHTV